MWLVHVARRRRNDPHIPTASWSSETRAHGALHCSWSELLRCRLLPPAPSAQTMALPCIFLRSIGFPCPIVEAIAEVSESSSRCRTAQGDEMKSRRMLATPPPVTSTDGGYYSTSIESATSTYVRLRRCQAVRLLPLQPAAKHRTTHKQDMAWIPPASRSTCMLNQKAINDVCPNLAGSHIDKLFNHALAPDCRAR